MYKKSEGLNSVLENQHKIFNEFISAENEGGKPISLENLGMDRKKSQMKNSVKTKI